jgi:hypothetical protein
MLSIKQLMLVTFVGLYNLGIWGVASASGPIDNGSEAAPLRYVKPDHLKIPMRSTHDLKSNVTGAR